jgi:hypothetical protein
MFPPVFGDKTIEKAIAPYADGTDNSFREGHPSL